MRIEDVTMCARDSETEGCYESHRIEIVDPGACGQAVSRRGGDEEPMQGTSALRDNRRLIKQDWNKNMETDGRKR